MERLSKSEVRKMNKLKKKKEKHYGGLFKE